MMPLVPLENGFTIEMINQNDITYYNIKSHLLLQTPFLHIPASDNPAKCRIPLLVNHQVHCVFGMFICSLPQQEWAN